ncbi:unnamed protein product [Brachionus calyciflorus]|uniref:HTH CENPB-type domain-containing protein n=1 Tax=Brachionus calyciflorus TaxID=104777 RepID=A0A813MU85_9BILA|nr:unnamed protein product [Brachionus calyciflorus]
MNTSKKRQKILNDTKVEIIKLKEETNKTDTEIAQLFGVDRSTVTKIIKKKEVYLNLENSDKKKSRVQKAPFHLVEEALFQWYCAAQTSSIQINHSVIKEKALFFFNKLKEDHPDMKSTFEASDGWISNFMTRYELNTKNSSSLNVNNDKNIKYEEDDDMEKNESYDAQSYDYNYNESDSENYNLDNTGAAETMLQNDLNSTLQQNYIQQQQQAQKIIQDAQTSKQALLLQNTLQQQIFQNQLAQAQTQQNQLALFKTPLNNSQLFNLIDTNALNQPIIQQQQQPIQQQQHQQNNQELSSNLVTKLELITEKLDQIKQITHLNNQNMPNMETQVLLQNIQRIVKENEQYKKDLYDKSAKIEEQNTKITELLLKAQNYVEQSHQFLELKNNSFQTSSEKTQSKILELEQDKMKLTSELTQVTSQISELNLEINRIKKEDLELRQQLNDVSKNTDQYKQNSERLLVENADLQTKLDTVLAELKKERQLRKTYETKNQLNEEEINELKSSLVNSQKMLEERKRKFESDRLLFDQELDELKKSNLAEVNALKEKLLKAKNNLSESQSEQIKQIENDLNHEWQIKLEKLLQQNESKHERKISELNEENSNLKRQLSEMSENLKNVRMVNSRSENETDKLKTELDDLKVYKEKYDRLQSQALVMKERYENRIKELLDAEPDTEIVAEEVKKLMNAMYKKIKSQIRPDQFYSGNGILIAMLKIIKMVTLQVLNSKNEELEEENIDYFSQHIYEPQVVTKPDTEAQTIKLEPVRQETTVIPETPKKEINIENKSEENSEDDDIQLISEEEEKNDFYNINNQNLVETQNENVILDEKIEAINKNDSSDENIEVIPDNEDKLVVEETQQMEVDKIGENDNVPEQHEENETVADEKIEEETKEEESIYDTDIKYDEKLETKELASKPMSKGLFDDEDDDDDEELFSLNLKPKQESKLFETESETPKAEETKKEEKNMNETPGNNSNSTTNQPGNFKFSPPPLFDDEEDENSDKDIDWFK